MDLLQRFIDFIRQNDLFHQKDKLLLAVSGGADSVVLCELCNQAGYDFSIAHCNFRLRGEESERDKKFVSQLAQKYGVAFFLSEFDTEKYAQENKLSIQEAARKLRYDWFARFVNHQSPVVSNQPSVHDSPFTIHDYILTAHHADDNIETLMLNFFRGTGLKGLTGIPVRTNTKVCRPLLGFWKEELMSFAKQNQLAFVEDSSNLSSKYSRNLFRNEIIPMIAKVYPEVKENLSNNLRRFKEIHKLYSVSVDELRKKLIRKKNNELRIPVKQLLSYQNRAVIFEVISGFGFSEKQIDDVVRLAESENGKYIQSPLSATRIIKFNNWFIVSQQPVPGSEVIIIEEGSAEVETENGKLKIQIVPNDETFRLPNSESIACLDAGLVRFPLLLRKWKQGDYFYPLGMKKKKKLTRFFIDQKLSKTQKEQAWVVEMNKKIIWVLGMRIDERFKITGKTKQILRLSLLPGQT